MIKSMKSPLKRELREWLKSDVSKWVFEVLAKEMNEIDTLRNITPENLDTHLAGRMAIELIENWLSEIYELAGIAEDQARLKAEEESIVRSLKEFKEEY